MRSDDPNVAAYLEEVTEERRPTLTRLRALIHEVAPDAEESMTYGMPTYTQDGPLCAFASQKQYMALYVHDREVMDAYRPKLGKLTASAGAECIRFRRAEDVPWALVADLLRAAVERRGTGVRDE
jgi:uncharacterized protein YdhG (YjbR/CyaY superfamily)